jgi:hypothetical protein
MLKLIVEIEEITEGSRKPVNIVVKTEEEQPSHVEHQVARRILQALKKMPDILNPPGPSSD